ncbi:nad-binding protein [Ceraceosorus bombacis]|uniref:Probable quinone oxidoreductase n=1 Tax=Ceraceosorus bombacis TaxID=401625 RepID=A0A0P1BHI6_9BASI|nr:nad-binding protein [Ceraceosorus bombacis]
MASSNIPERMRAIRVPETGEIDVISAQDIAVPEPGADEVLIKVSWAGVNYIDTYQRSGLYTLPLPFTAGMEAAGKVVKFGKDADDSSLKVGDAVAAYALGAYAEYMTVKREKVVKLPDGVSEKDGATAILQGLTAWTLLHEAYQVKKGDAVLIHAAAGGVGLLLCQMASYLGATVIGTVSTEEKAALAKSNGASHVINSKSGGAAVVDEVLKLTKGEGVQGIYDGVGKDTWEDGFKMIARKGTIVSFGNASGAVPPFPVLKLAAKNTKVVRPTLNNSILTRQELETYSAQLFDLLAKKLVKLRVHKEYPFSAEGVQQTQKDITSRATTGKLLIKVQQ